ncbi:isoprenylcysteine carboxylmethyltransferase family protein [Candidatus Parcubacteria bacterium]|nr:isoprenylcysteine carboxylmethyltransferase family protein [Candidatus Parcubacteria bacterium]
MSRFYNLLGATPLIIWYVWGLSEQIPVFIQHFPHTPASVLSVFQAIAQATNIAFVSFLILLLIVRDVPKMQARSFAPCAAAQFGTFAATAFLFLPTAALPVPLLATAMLCIAAGLGLSVYALIYLGRSFAILPSARTLVILGPYRLVRHPLYLFEEVAVVGIMLQFVQPWSLLIFMAQLAAQFARMHYEERILTQVFPEYSAYASRTARFIPGIY